MSNMMNPVRSTTIKVVMTARDVKIRQEKIEELAERWIHEGIKVPAWPTEMHLWTSQVHRLLDYLILLDGLNFCFWPVKGQEKWNIIYRGKKYDGYFALSLALKQFFEINPEKANLHYFSGILFKEFASIFDGGRGLQFLKKRWQIARMISKIIMKNYGNSENFLRSADHQLAILVPKIANELFSFNDMTNYRGRRVYLWKRAQILGSDIYGAFNGRGLGHFDDLDYLTAFADYKVPQILHSLGILEYSLALKEKISRREIIKAGSVQEVEIRSATIWAIEYLRDELERLGKSLHAFQVDWILWNKAQKSSMPLPYHLCETMYY